MKTVAIIQARLGSQRLPGKVLSQICGKPMVERVHQRVARCQSVDQVVVATSDSPEDDVLADFCESKGWAMVRGSEDDVLSRFVLAADTFQADRIVRITSDCPLLDSAIVDQVVDALEGYDYACNFFPQRLYPRGLDAEAMTAEALHRIDAQAKSPRHREHVTLLAYERPSEYRVASVSNRLDHSHLRWTVDTESDLKLIQTIYTHFSRLDQEEFGYADIMRALSKNWQWCEINREVRQKVA